MNRRAQDALTALVSTIHSPADMDRAQRVERAITNDGQARLDDRDFLPIRSPDGSTWRLRVDNSGNLSITKVTN